MKHKEDAERGTRRWVPGSPDGNVPFSDPSRTDSPSLLKKKQPSISIEIPCIFCICFLECCCWCPKRYSADYQCSPHRGTVKFLACVLSSGESLLGSGLITWLSCFVLENSHFGELSTLGHIFVLFLNQLCLNLVQGLTQIYACTCSWFS